MAKKMQKHYPAQKMIRVGDQTNGTAGGRLVRVDRLLTMTNRRLYRQSRVYSAKVDVDIGSALATAGIDVYVLRDTWDLHGAYKYAMEHYYNAMKEELHNAKGAQTRWHDFRVTSDFQADELIPITTRPDSTNPTMSIFRLTTGDFDLSTVVDSTGTTRGFTLGLAGGSPDEFSIQTEWARKDRVQEDPASQSTTMPYSGLVEDLDEANYDILRDNGAVPPYGNDADTGLWTKVCTIQETGGTGKLTTGYFDAPLGFVLLISSGFTGDGVLVTEQPITVHVQSGNYKGVKAAPYATPRLTAENKYEVV